ncbi:MAG: helix-turn-helix domain-containing protein [Saccharofermentans sp.]|nr:helix-turn-helix domain-containing protein [Saccharofermentans sp.]
MDQKKTGQFLKILRNEKGLTQEQLAKHFNVSNRSVSRWETGSNLPDISLLVEIADFYDVDVREIIDGERKSEMMEKETREVADKMAAYATGEKSKLLKFVQVLSIVGVVITIISIVLQTISYEPDLKRAGSIFATLIAFIIMCVITLYVTGLLSRFSKHKKAVKAVKIVTVALMVIVTQYVLFTTLILGLALAMFASSPVELSTDVSEYNKYIHNGSGYSSEYMMGNYPQFDIMPETIDAEVIEYQIMYYNPWDAQYIVYMTLDYGEGYSGEIDRLEAIGIDDYKGIYTVTGEPEGYDLVAMDSDDYNGFVYALIPEGDSSNTKITYCAIMFCNYMLDVDVHDYMPDRYLLEGFDATADNPYEQQMMKGR